MIGDVLSSIFDLVDLPTLCASSHVSRLWRIIARNHPTYWKILTLDADSMSAAEVVLFLDRLTAKSDPDAIFSLSLRCPASTSALNRLVLTSLVLPIVRAHIHRAEELAFVVSPSFATALWPLFSLDAPRLRGLQVIVDNYEGGLDPVPSLFNAHAHTSLERVLIRDVPFPARAQPLGHVLKSLKATYTIYSDIEDSFLERLLAWVPYTQTLDLWPMDRRYRSQLPRLPDLGVSQLRTLQHLVVHHERHLLGIPHRLIPILSIRTPLRTPDCFRHVIPDAVPLALCFRVRMIRDRRYAIAGRVIVATLDGSYIREFGRLKLRRMTSAFFLEEIMPCDRLVALTMPLAVGFRTLCEKTYFFPRLATLRLVLNCLPEPVPGWDAGAILCPKLSTLILQREVEQEDASIPLASLHAFVLAAVTVDRPENVHVVLEGIRLVGDERNDSATSIECRLPAASWDAEGPREPDHNWISRRPGRFGPEAPRMGWLC